MDDSYSLKEVIEEKFDDIDKKITANHNGVFEYLRRIETQTTKTNGRVNSLEMSRAQMWGAIAVLTLLGGVIITLAINAIDSKIDSKINSALQSYDKSRFLQTK